MLGDERWWAPQAKLDPVGSSNLLDDTIIVRKGLLSRRRCIHLQAAPAANTLSKLLAGSSHPSITLCNRS